MARIERDYTNLKETERIWDAVTRNSTNVKDLSLQRIVGVTWRINEFEDKSHLNRIKIGQSLYIGRTDSIKRAIHELVERQDEHDWLPRDVIRLGSWDDATPDLFLDTTGVNDECLRDHVARVTIGNDSAIIDLEELLKATRYA